MSYGVSTANALSQANAQEPRHVSPKDMQDGIKCHPLFSLLALAFEKCELATCTAKDLGINIDICSSESFISDIQSFAMQLQNRAIMFPTSCPHIDNLMILAIQVLRIHLVELEKVHQLCDNFCKRYLSSLNGRMPLDIVLEEDSINQKGFDHIQNIEINDSSLPSYKERTLHSNWDTDCIENDYLKTAYNTRESPINNLPSCAFSKRPEYPGSPDSSETTCDSSIIGKEDDENEKPKHKKRGIFPKMATNIMKAWLFQHLTHPYPSEEQKRLLANDTGLTILQVNNWFINARRRIVQPMIESSSSRGGKSPYVTIFKSRKRKVSYHGMVQHNPHYQPATASYQRSYGHQLNYNPSVPSAHFGNGDLTSDCPIIGAQSPHQTLSGIAFHSSPFVYSPPNCMETRSQPCQSRYGHWSTITHSNPVFSTESPLQNDQFYVVAS